MDNISVGTVGDGRASLPSQVLFDCEEEITEKTLERDNTLQLVQNQNPIVEHAQLSNSVV